jgi:peptidoglycan/LPS O-acetylase OafA/YrhL
MSLSRHEDVSVVDRLLTRLRRVTSSGRYLPQVDGIRFIAISTVVLFHVNRYLYKALQPQTAPRFIDYRPDAIVERFLREGRLGVMVFFTLSGFILSLPFVAWRLENGKRVSLRSYFVRRITRIEPPYLVSLGLFALLAGTTQLWGPLTDVMHRFEAGLWYGHTLSYGVPNLINPPYWTLEIEIQFYIVVPVLALAFLVRSRWFRRALIAVAALAATLVQVDHGVRLAPGHAFGFLPNYIEWFLVGFLIADIFVTDWKQHPTTSYLWDAVSLVGWPVFFLMGANTGAVAFVLLPWLLLPLFVAVFRGTLTSRALSNRWVTTIGGMTYSIYLVHTPIIAIAVQHTGGLFSDSFSVGNVLVQVLVLTPIVLAGSLVFYLLIERPCMNPRWPVNLARRLTGRAVSPVSHPVPARVDRRPVPPMPDPPS